ncbi:4-alpha-glucanotransferase [Cupriavidus gilardii CR3]|uniref:4-alpha-glucanotransferase n=1 Tax=Cupriavidus gilardii TaxID=82541 RepID=A0A849BI57_9BURK|nr:4-alpha-glucanotransferase [Cupriavidus gilardii]ALD93395.1 4-alpha-glucanotransferase [Cupriavidus gilardii CR3]KAB0599218.1 4-alpha-glucanotransferase [Cupriavidus gilardii]MCT9013339.1 4-alpha-glucanotransferase [Cupriavidus gilardii]MCT9052893.1 4-alpha-glucanotransferase [Cupriavidus gilardii]NNH13996.1 4-alpha-glucanotransferase [Cupriavidus gilardii]
MPRQANPDAALASLHLLAQRAGLLVHWQDAQGRERVVPEASLRAVLERLDLPCRTIGQCEASRARMLADDAATALAPLLTADQGKPIRVPLVHTRQEQPFRLELEDGSVQTGVARRDAHGALIVPAVQSHGYHRLLMGDVEVKVAVAPLRCFGVQDALRGIGLSEQERISRKPWGPSVQVYGLRRGAPAGIGDLSALAMFAEAAAREGADAVAISPLHAGFAAFPERYSPYSPSSRLFLNVLYADPAPVFGQAAVARAISALQLGGLMQTLESKAEIDWPAVAQARLKITRWLWDHRDQLLPADAADDLAKFRANGGTPLLAHAAFEALQAQHVAQAGTRAELQVAGDWRRWPVTHRSPQDAALSAFASAFPDEIGYHVFLQWLADDGLRAAQRSARDAGMAIGLIGDLAVGTAPTGSHAWTRQNEMLQGFSAGAPPDVYNALGQSWGITVFSPRGLRRHGYTGFIEMLRANLAHVGGLRIDHALGLARVWLVPEGMPPESGAYLRYPMDDLLRLIALESWRHRAIIIGENLGTVPDTFNATLAERGMLGIDVLWFEREQPDKQDNGKAAEPPPAPAPFVPPERWPANAVATSATHDLPTIAGWWAGQDITWRARLDQLGPDVTEAGARAERARDRQALWQALCDAGLARGEAPDPDRAPVATILAWLSRTRTPLRLVPVEDLLADVEQPNLPGTTSGHPNWQRRLRFDVQALFGQPGVQRRIDALRTGRAPKS